MSTVTSSQADQPYERSGRSLGAGRSLVWIDDRPKRLSGHVAGLKSHGWQVDVYRPDEDFRESARNADALLLDLRWTAPAYRAIYARAKKPFPNSRVLAQELTVAQPRMPLLLVSNFFADAHYANIEREISPAAFTDRVQKIGDEGQSVSKAETNDVVEEIESKLARLIELSEETDSQIPENRINGTSDEVSAVFGVTPRDYDHLDVAARLDLAKRAGVIVRDLVEWEFANSDAAWLLIGGTPPRVLYWGHQEDALPDSDIDNIADTYGSVPFFYSRPQNIL